MFEGMNLEDYKAELYRARQGVYEQMRCLSSESKEYTEYCKDFDQLNKAIDMMEKAELEKKRVEGDLENRKAEALLKEKELKNNLFIECLKIGGIAASILFGIWQTGVITEFEKTNVITTKVFGLITKPLSNLKMF